jgi:hypothetical protein
MREGVIHPHDAMDPEEAFGIDETEFQTCCGESIH